jgi:hypothetical protein
MTRCRLCKFAYAVHRGLCHYCDWFKRQEAQ